MNNIDTYKKASIENRDHLKKRLYDLAADIDAGDVDVLDFLVIRNLGSQLRRMADEQDSMSTWMEQQLSGISVRQQSG